MGSIISSGSSVVQGVDTAAQAAAAGKGEDISSGAGTDAAVNQINANAQDQLKIAQAQSNASVLQAVGEALKSGASSLTKAAQAS
ncbi:MAG TPA: hypothetical protein VFE79_21245 [Paraburkholderia sp.]|jgi:hypothetical protein|nr:hypothetical protein [Paraburkholderia sp.]